MPVFNAGGIIADSWRAFDDAESIPAGAAAIVSWERAIAENGKALTSGGPRGVFVSSDFEVAKLLPVLNKLGLVAVRPANFKDGRVFSAGRLLRQRFGFNGDLRAQGEFIPDQVPFLVRCGFTSFEVGPAFDIAAALKLLDIFPFNYQTGLADRNIADLRHPAAARRAALGA